MEMNDERRVGTKETLKSVQCKGLKLLRETVVAWYSNMMIYSTDQASGIPQEPQRIYSSACYTN